MKCSCILIRLRHNPVFSRRTVNSVLVSLSTSGTCTHVPSSDYAKFCSQIGYINSSNRITHHQEMGRGCSHVNVLKFFRLSKCSASRGFVSDSWATCYPRGASDARVIAIIACLCICPCVTRRYCIKTAKHRMTQITPRDSPGTLLFWCQKSLVDDPSSP